MRETSPSNCDLEPAVTGGIDGTNMEEDTPSHHPDSLLDETSGM